MNKFIWLVIAIGFALLFYAVFVFMQPQPAEAPQESNFIGPTGPPSVIGPSEPPPNAPQ